MKEIKIKKHVRYKSGVDSEKEVVFGKKEEYALWLKNEYDSLLNEDKFKEKDLDQLSFPWTDDEITEIEKFNENN